MKTFDFSYIYRKIERPYESSFYCSYLFYAIIPIRSDPIDGISKKVPYCLFLTTNFCLLLRCHNFLLCINSTLNRQEFWKRNQIDSRKQAYLHLIALFCMFLIQSVTVAQTTTKKSSFSALTIDRFNYTLGVYFVFVFFCYCCCFCF